VPYKYTAETWVDRAVEVHGTFYDYSKVDYNGYSDYVTIGCPIHGWFRQKSYVHLRGCGCQTCAQENSLTGFHPDKPAILYYLKDTPTGWYKIGITNRTIPERYTQEFQSRIKVILTEYFQFGIEALEKEKELHDTFKNYRVNNESWRIHKDGNGYTEFFTKDVMCLDNLLLPYYHTKEKEKQ
jgi:hypothetical protein